MSRISLNEQGVAHWLFGALVVALIALAGVRVMTASHAAPASTDTSSSMTVTPVSLGPLQSADETSDFIISHDFDSSVVLPNGNDLMLYADTTERTYDTTTKTWNLTGFIGGSAATEGKYSVGKLPQDFDEVNIGKPLAASNKPSLFIPKPTDVYNPNGTGGLCVAGAATGTPSDPDSTTISNEAAVRWPTGIVVMPSSANVLVTYEDVCVISAVYAVVEGWGFMEYDSNTNTIYSQPNDLYAPASDGASIAFKYAFGSPVIMGNDITLFSSDCTTDDYGTCEDGYIDSTTMPASASALAAKGNYAPKPISLSNGSNNWNPLWMTVNLYNGKLLMLEGTSVGGTFKIYKASAPTDPWKNLVDGTLPGCFGLSSDFCRTYSGHPEYSSSSQMLVTYENPLYEFNSFGHVMMANIPLK